MTPYSLSVIGCALCYIVSHEVGDSILSYILLLLVHGVLQRRDGVVMVYHILGEGSIIVQRMRSVLVLLLHTHSLWILVS